MQDTDQANEIDDMFDGIPTESAPPAADTGELTEQLDEVVLHDSAFELADYAPTRLDLDNSMTYEQWAVVGGSLLDMANSISWWLGDWWLQGEAMYGESCAQEAPTNMRTLSTMTNAAAVCERIPPERRVDGVSYSVHAEVAYMSDQGKADEFLQRASAEGWTVLQTREAKRLWKESIEAASTPAGSASSSGSSEPAPPVSEPEPDNLPTRVATSIINAGLADVDAVVLGVERIAVSKPELVPVVRDLPAWLRQIADRIEQNLPPLDDEPDGDSEGFTGDNVGDEPPHSREVADTIAEHRDDVLSRLAE